MFAAFCLLLAQEPPAPTAADRLRQMWSRGQCEGQGAPRFSVSPMDPADIGVILPLGLMVDAHVTPIDHQYYSPKDLSLGRDAYPVRSPVDGRIVLIQHRDRFVGDRDAGDSTSEFRIVIEHSCTFWIYFDLITSLDAGVAAQLEKTPAGMESAWVRIPVKAGEAIGRIGAQTLDIGVVNTEVTLKGFVVPEHYDAEPWKIHSVDSFDYYDEPLRAELLALNPRTAEPRGGKIDYDIDGRLAGNWFREGTNGYQGVDRSRYWAGHFSAAYHFIDPHEITLSFGDYDGRSRQFWVKGNAPNPADVSVETGLVVYELVPVGTFFQGRGSTTVIRNRQDDRVDGVALLELIEDRKLKLEVFPGKTAVEVTGFSDAALIYSR